MFLLPESNHINMNCQETSLELVEISEDGVLQTVFEQTVFGIIKDIAVLRWNDRYQQFIPQVLTFIFYYIFILDFDVNHENYISPHYSYQMVTRIHLIKKMKRYFFFLFNRRKEEICWLFFRILESSLFLPSVLRCIGC